MPRKDKEENKRRALARYYANREKILEYQKRYVKNRYHQDPQFKKKYNTRRATAHKYPLKNEKCEVCKSSNDLQRHHINYTTKREDIKILCRYDHNRQHHIPRSNRWNRTLRTWVEKRCKRPLNIVTKTHSPITEEEGLSCIRE